MSIHADLVLIDERKGTQVAIDKGLDATGTLGILQRAAQKGLLDLADAFERLKRTNFRYRQEIMDRLLSKSARTKTFSRYLLPFRSHSIPFRSYRSVTIARLYVKPAGDRPC